MTADETALGILAAGNLGAFHGLGAGDDRAAAEAAFGPSEPGPDGVGPLMGELLPFRRYEHGVVVWFGTEDRVLLVELQSPALDAAGLLVLGEPEVSAPSRLDPILAQTAWPSRGLAAHVSRMDGSVRVLYAFAPMAAEAYTSWLGEAEGPRRVPRA